MESSTLVVSSAEEVDEVTIRRRGREVALRRAETGRFAGAGAPAALGALVERLLAMRGLRPFGGDPAAVVCDELALPTMEIEARSRDGRSERVVLAMGYRRAEAVAFATRGGAERALAVPYVELESLAALLDVMACADAPLPAGEVGRGA